MRPALLVIERPPLPPLEHKIERRETLIGRGTACDLQIADTDTSREHALVSFEDGEYSIEDLQTTNGTLVNGRRVRTSPLADGDEITIGDTRIVFRSGDSASPAG